MGAKADKIVRPSPLRPEDSARLAADQKMRARRAAESPPPPTPFPPAETLAAELETSRRRIAAAVRCLSYGAPHKRWNSAALFVLTCPVENLPPE